MREREVHKQLGQGHAQLVNATGTPRMEGGSEAYRGSPALQVYRRRSGASRKSVMPVQCPPRAGQTLGCRKGVWVEEMASAKALRLKCAQQEQLSQEMGWGGLRGRGSVDLGGLVVSLAFLSFSGGSFLKSLLHLLQYRFCFRSRCFWPPGLWGLRARTHTPCIGR